MVLMDSIDAFDLATRFAGRKEAMHKSKRRESISACQSRSSTILLPASDATKKNSECSKAFHTKTLLEPNPLLNPLLKNQMKTSIGFIKNRGKAILKKIRDEISVLAAREKELQGAIQNHLDKAKIRHTTMNYVAESVSMRKVIKLKEEQAKTSEGISYLKRQESALLELMKKAKVSPQDELNFGSAYLSMKLEFENIDEQVGQILTTCEGSERSFPSTQEELLAELTVLIPS